MKKMKRNENNQVLFDYCKSRYFDLYKRNDSEDVNNFTDAYSCFEAYAEAKPTNLCEVYNNYSRNKEIGYHYCLNEYKKLVNRLLIEKCTPLFIESYNIFQFTLSAYFIFNKVIYKIHFTKAKSEIIQLSELSF